VERLDPEAEHERSALHRDAVRAARQVACFYCRSIYDPAEIIDWTDDDRQGVGQTAICPQCGVDAVIPVRDGVNASFLSAMHDRWFS
jgi:hypothetical protein